MELEIMDRQCRKSPQKDTEGQKMLENKKAPEW